MAQMSIRQTLWQRIKEKRINVLIAALIFIVFCVFLIAALQREVGTFTITTPRRDMIALGLVLSDEPEFRRPRHELRSDPVYDMWNITETDLPADIDNIDGSHNGDDYLAYTFYVKNISNSPVLYTAAADIADMYLAVDDAMRTKVYYNDKPVVYAKRARSGDPEPNTTPFVSDTCMVRMTDLPLGPGEVDKFTFVVWLEGNDPECINNILGGFVKLTMDFTGKDAS